MLSAWLPLPLPLPRPGHRWRGLGDRVGEGRLWSSCTRLEAREKVSWPSSWSRDSLAAGLSPARLCRAFPDPDAEPEPTPGSVGMHGSAGTARLYSLQSRAGELGFKWAVGRGGEEDAAAKLKADAAGARGRGLAGSRAAATAGCCSLAVLTCSGALRCCHCCCSGCSSSWLFSGEDRPSCTDSSSPDSGIEALNAEVNAEG